MGNDKEKSQEGFSARHEDIGPPSGPFPFVNQDWQRGSQTLTSTVTVTDLVANLPICGGLLLKHRQDPQVARLHT